MNRASVETTVTPTSSDILTDAREQVLERGIGLTREQTLAVLRLGDDHLEKLL
ncbi:biotin synthase BioB, partial [Nocardia sp. NPDC003345]